MPVPLILDEFRILESFMGLKCAKVTTIKLEPIVRKVNEVATKYISNLTFRTQFFIYRWLKLITRRRISPKNHQRPPYTENSIFTQ